MPFPVRPCPMRLTQSTRKRFVYLRTVLHIFKTSALRGDDFEKKSMNVFYDYTVL